MKQLGNVLRQVWPSLLFLVLGGALLWLIGLSLWGDYRLRDSQFERIQDARIAKPSCSTRLFVISFCEIRADGASLPGGRIELNYLLLGDTEASSPIALLRATGPEPVALRHVTTTYGMEHLTARLVSFGVLELAMLGLVLAPLVGLLRRRDA
jgi:hypothetical protein